jgi:hypothetical protein
MLFDDSELADVAAVLVVANPHWHGTAAALMDFMRSCAYRHLSDGKGYVSTFGFVLTGWTDPTGEPACKASLSGWTVARYLAGLGIAAATGGAL